jgi:hypothetical protein
MRDIAAGAFERLSLPGDYRYKAATGESQNLKSDPWLSATEMTDRPFNLPHNANAGDVSAVLAAHI